MLKLLAPAALSAPVVVALASACGGDSAVVFDAGNDEAKRGDPNDAAPGDSSSSAGDAGARDSTATDATTDATHDAMTLDAGDAAGHGFYVKGGQIIGPGGAPFVAKGINIYDSQTSCCGSADLSKFPGMNMVRLAIEDPSTNSPSTIKTFVDLMTGAGVVVIVEDHSAPSANDNVPTGQALADELAWYTAMASAYKDNPYVWFGTMNEPNNTSDIAAVGQQEVAIYQAIRGTGSGAIVLLEMRGGFTADFAKQSPASYASMTNVAWDAHYYGWIANYSTDQNAVTQALTAQVADAQSTTSGDGTIPVIIGEYGPSTTGSGNFDANYNEVIFSVQKSGIGTLAWAWSAGADALVDDKGDLNAYGGEVAGFIGSGAVASF